MKTALITGITGQDGSYLAELLLKKDYEVHGIIRRSANFNTQKIIHIFEDPHKPNPKLKLHYGDLADASSINRIIENIKPDEIYNLGAQSHVRVSFDIPEYTSDIDALGALRLLDAMRKSDINARFYQASSSELYGKVQEVPQTEDTPFYPRSPYAVAKQYAYWITKNYREAYDIFACNGILFNHESERRGETFVSRKITRGLARIKLGKDNKLYLGNLNAKRDWGYAKDYVYAMWLMLQQEEPEDFVIASGKSHSVRDFIEKACNHLEIDLEWKGKDLEEVGIDRKTGETIIEIDPRYFRPTEVDELLGDASKAKEKLGWEPETSFDDLVKIMAEHDLKNEAKN